ncbi:ArsR/SmtB family transcription factor [Cellulomonas dongxiuzhuiae]|uniref:Metalloregulator ArsR/SmtB family transcription factor n=1 Tax=Cellulomonas dongxiuzhuiae TaxID=2819979 RepID=A0ABX8GFU8_9CELL|nr:metalloregulator ArsR/SmtB family transcription factor [Cellulomonas dongxiuzhuiae]MBO3086994.1 winged helix-turn-helix transcriptional regulator [Cellulomonas dongxiuzhuiae]MBO3093648.1 winged helix-turn-helix transcriptional regulator [Cellulomonas dongxiuzhuiae]QWC14763.1 metalloregulator ArsR/SmtB family transcription factor [Cellulomonas dongxiuzhuiae]
MPVHALGVDRPLADVKAELFKALAHPVRVRTLELLVVRDRQVSELLVELGLEASHLSQHLAVLRRAGVVTARRTGNAVHYALALPAVAEMLSAARAVLVDAATRHRDRLDETTAATSSDTTTDTTA